MNRNRSSFLIFNVAFALILLSSGCGPGKPPKITVQIQETQSLDDPNHETCVVLTIIHTPESRNGYTVYRGPNVNSDSAFPQLYDEILQAEIGAYVEHILRTDESRIGVLVECDGKVPNRVVEIVKSGVRQSKVSVDRPLFVGVIDDRSDQN